MGVTSHHIHKSPHPTSSHSMGGDSITGGSLEDHLRILPAKRFPYPSIQQVSVSGPQFFSQMKLMAIPTKAESLLVP